MEKDNLVRKESGHRNPPRSNSSMEVIDPVLVAPKIYRVLFENELVRVLKVTVEAGHKEPMHSHPAHIIYPLTGGWIRFRTPEDVKDVRFSKGKIHIANAVSRHSMENMGRTVVNAMLIERKDRKPHAMWGRAPAIESPDVYKVLGENDLFRISDFTLKPGMKEDFFNQPAFVYIVLSDAQGSLHFRSGTVEDIQFTKGDIGFKESGGRFTMLNTGNRSIRLILFEVKGAGSMRTKRV